MTTFRLAKIKPEPNWHKGEQITPQAGVIFERRRYFVPALSQLAQEQEHLPELPYDESPRERYEVTDTNADAWFNAVSSELVSGKNLHAPAVDVDHHCRLIPSSTSGHWHLYIDVAMSWWRYRLLLWAFKVAGVIEPGYYRVSLTRKATFLRRPEYYKEEMTRADRIDELTALRDRLRSAGHDRGGPARRRRPETREPRHDRADTDEPF